VREAGINMHVAGDVDRIRRCACADDFCIEAYRHVKVVIAGHEDDGIALRPELVVALHSVDFVDLLLHGGCGHGGIKDDDVGPEVRIWSWL